MTETKTPKYPWYGLVSGAELEQGDLLFGCPVFLIPPAAIRDPSNHPRKWRENGVRENGVSS